MSRSEPSTCVQSSNGRLDVTIVEALAFEMDRVRLVLIERVYAAKQDLPEFEAPMEHAIA